MAWGYCLNADPGSESLGQGQRGCTCNKLPGDFEVAAQDCTLGNRASSPCWPDISKGKNWELGLFFLRCSLMCLDWARLPKSTFLYGPCTDLNVTKSNSIQFNSTRFNSVQFHSLQQADVPVLYIYPYIWWQYLPPPPFTHFCLSSINSPTNIPTVQIIKEENFHFLFRYALPIFGWTQSHTSKLAAGFLSSLISVGISALFCFCHSCNDSPGLVPPP